MGNQGTCSDRFIEANIYCKLKRRGKWGAANTDIENLLHYISKDQAGRVKGIVRDLVKRGTLLTKPGNFVRVSLNPRKKKEIEECIASEPGITLLAFV